MSEPSEKGPREARIEKLWDSAWAALKNGEVHDPWVDAAAAQLGRFRDTLPKGDPAAAADLSRAETHHLLHNRLLAESIVRLSEFRTWMNSLKDLTHQEALTFNQHIIRSLTLAHGALVVGSLALMGDTLDRPLRTGLVNVIVVCSIGFLLVLLSSYASVQSLVRSYRILSELALVRMPHAEVKTKVSKLTSGFSRFASGVLMLGSAVCLVVALYIGVTALSARP